MGELIVERRMTRMNLRRGLRRNGQGKRKPGVQRASDVK
jgi:hypothetical protein